MNALQIGLVIFPYVSSQKNPLQELYEHDSKYSILNTTHLFENAEIFFKNVGDKVEKTIDELEKALAASNSRLITAIILMVLVAAVVFYFFQKRRNGSENCVINLCTGRTFGSVSEPEHTELPLEGKKSINTLVSKVPTFQTWVASPKNSKSSVASNRMYSISDDFFLKKKANFFMSEKASFEKF